MLGRRLVGAFIAIVLIIAVVTFALGYLLLRPLFYGDTVSSDTTTNASTAPFVSNTALRTYARGVNAAASEIRIVVVDNVSLLRFSPTTRFSQGGAQISAAQIYPCSTVSALGRRDGTAFIADQIELIPVSQAAAGTFRADVIVDSIGLLPIPDQRTTSITTLTRGMRLDLLGRCIDWLAVIAPGNIHGWIRRESLNVTDNILNQLPWLALDPARLRP